MKHSYPIQIRGIPELLGVLSIIGLFSGCSSVPSQGVNLVDQTNMIDYRIAGNSIPTSQLDSIRNPGDYKIKGFGRYVDPNHPDSLYLGGKMVRRESTETFNLRPGPIPLSMARSSPSSSPSEAYNPAFSAELEQKIENQNRIMSAMMEENKVLQKQSAQNATIAEQMIKIQQENLALKADLKTTLESIKDKKKSPDTKKQSPPRGWWDIGLPWQK